MRVDMCWMYTVVRLEVMCWGDRWSVAQHDFHNSTNINIVGVLLRKGLFFLFALDWLRFCVGVDHIY